MDRKIVRTLVIMILVAIVVEGTMPSLKSAIDAVNKVRTTPTSFIDVININYSMKTNNITNAHSEWSIRFNEAAPTQFNTAITYLNQSGRAVSSLSLDLGLSYAMYKHLKYLGDVLGYLSHTGQGGSTLSQRINEYSNTTYYYAAENVMYMLEKPTFGPEQFLANLIIDDGVSSRGHRTNLMSSTYKKIGMAFYQPQGSDIIYFGMDLTSSAYGCGKCDLITCQMQSDMGWKQYLKDTSQTDPCVPPSTTSSSSTSTGVDLTGTNNNNENFTDNGGLSSNTVGGSQNNNTGSSSSSKTIGCINIVLAFIIVLACSC